MECSAPRRWRLQIEPEQRRVIRWSSYGGAHLVQSGRHNSKIEAWAEALRMAVSLGYTPRRWWQWWRWRDPSNREVLTP